MASLQSQFPTLSSNISSRDSFDYDGLPPELAAEAQALNRKQQMANYLIQQGLQPAQGQMTGRFYVPPSPLQGLAGLAQVFTGSMMSGMNDDKRKAISKDSSTMLADAMRQYKEASGPRITEGPRPTAPMASPPPSTGPHAGLMPQPAQPPQQMELPGPGAPVSTPRSPEETRQAMVDLMLNPHPQAQRIGGVLAGQHERAQEHGLQREFLGQQNNLLRQNRIDTQQAGFGRDLIMASQLGLNKKDLEEIKATNAKALEGMKGSNSATVANINAGSRENVAGMKSGANRPMSATAQKELIQTEEEMQGAHAGMKSLDQALALNDQAMGFSGAGMLAGAGSLLPESVRPKAIDATVELDNILTSGALPQLKAIFGGMPTEGERKVLLDVQGSSGKTPAVRKEIFERAKESLQNRLRFSGQKTEQLRKGTYFTGEGGLDTTVSHPGQAPSSAPPSTTQGKVRKYNPATGKIE